MQKTIGMLAILLAAQLALAVGMSYTGPDLAPHRPDTPFLALGAGTVDRVTIDAPDDQHLVLARQGDAWVLPGTGDFPADQGKVERLLGQLKDLKRGLAVATTGGALKRFKVSDDAFERRLTLARNGKTIATLYLGTSPGIHRVHARTGGDEAVYTAEFGVYDVPVKPDDWEDKGLLKIPPDEIESIGLADLTLTRSPATPATQSAGNGAPHPPAEKRWTSTGLADGETVNQTNTDTLEQQLAGLSIASVLGTEGKPEYGLAEPALVVSVQRKGGKPVEYRIGKREKEKDYVLKASSRPEYFRLPAYTADVLVKAAGRDQLVSAAGPADGNTAAQAPDASPPAHGADAPRQTAPAAGTS